RAEPRGQGWARSISSCAQLHPAELERARNGDRRHATLGKVSPRHRSHIIPAWLIMAAVGGLLLAVYLIIESGAAQVAHAMLVIGWWLVPISMFHLLPMLFSALSWRQLIPATSRPDAFTSVRIRWIRESINSLLPVAGVGGDVASVRLARLQGVPATEAAT